MGFLLEVINVGDNDEFYSHDQIVRDLYFGSGRNNPSITARLADLENFQRLVEKREDSRDSRNTALILLAITQLCVLIGGLVTMLAKSH